MSVQIIDMRQQANCSIGGWPFDDGDSTPKNCLTLFSVYEGARKMLVDYADKIRVLNDPELVDPNLSEKGVLAKRRDAGMDALQPYPALKKRLDAEAKDMKDPFGDIFTAPKGPREIQREDILLRFVRRLTPAEKLDAIHNALAKGPDDADSMELLSAIVLAPKALMVVNEPTRAMILEEIARQQNPDKVHANLDLGAAYDSASFALQRAKDHVLADSGNANDSDADQKIRDRLVGGAVSHG
jgi:hypothetical protein